MARTHKLILVSTTSILNLQFHTKYTCLFFAICPNPHVHFQSKLCTFLTFNTDIQTLFQKLSTYSIFVELVIMVKLHIVNIQPYLCGIGMSNVSWCTCSSWDWWRKPLLKVYMTCYTFEDYVHMTICWTRPCNLHQQIIIQESYGRNTHVPNLVATW